MSNNVLIVYWGNLSTHLSLKWLFTKYNYSKFTRYFVFKFRIEIWASREGFGWTAARNQLSSGAKRGVGRMLPLPSTLPPIHPLSQNRWFTSHRLDITQLICWKPAILEQLIILNSWQQCVTYSLVLSKTNKRRILTIVMQWMRRLFISCVSWDKSK